MDQVLHKEPGTKKMLWLLTEVLLALCFRILSRMEYGNFIVSPLSIVKLLVANDMLKNCILGESRDQPISGEKSNSTKGALKSENSSKATAHLGSIPASFLTGQRFEGREV
jgi:hypothetical protein